MKAVEKKERASSFVKNEWHHMKATLDLEQTDTLKARQDA